MGYLQVEPLRDLPGWFARQLYRRAFPRALPERFRFPTSSQTTLCSLSSSVSPRGRLVLKWTHLWLRAGGL